MRNKLVMAAAALAFGLSMNAEAGKKCGNHGYNLATCITASPNTITTVSDNDYSRFSFKNNRGIRGRCRALKKGYVECVTKVPGNADLVRYRGHFDDNLDITKWEVSEELDHLGDVRFVQHILDLWYK